MAHCRYISVAAFAAFAVGGCSSDAHTGATGGAASDASSAETSSTGGQAAATGGSSGSIMGGRAATSSGGAAASGAAAGGANANGGASEAEGGKATAGAGSGTAGNGTGGAKSPGGACQPSSCGSHKWACWPMPNPASSDASVPHHQAYTDLGNGAVRDDVTCLVWEKANPNTPGNWQANHDRCAALAASSYAGFSDWRLPTRVEMASIVDVTRGSKGFPAVFTLTSGYYLTGSFWYKTILTDKDTTAGNETDMVWGYGANGFTSNAILRTGMNVARCVSGNGAGEAADAYAVEPANHYTTSGGQVTDNLTGLVWQRGRSPSLMAWDAASNYCATLSVDGTTGWRVPTINELASTVNEAKVGGAIVDAAFPDNPVGCKAPEYWFWAAEASKVGGVGWGLSYCDGFTGWNVGASGDWNYFPTANVRCVR